MFDRLNLDTKRFLYSTVGYAVSDILLFTFGYALIYLQTNSVIGAAVFNLAFYVTLLIAFFLNGKLLEIYSAKFLFITGGILQGLVMICLYFLPPSDLWQVAIFGLIYGLPLGLYWGNRNRLYLYFTTDHNRHFFEGTRKLLTDPLMAVAPMIAGWSIVWLQNWTVVPTKIVAYQLVGVVGLVILFLSMIPLYQAKFPKLKVKIYRLPRITKHWQLFRWFVLISSVQFALVLSLPEILTLKYLGNEGVLGTLKMVFVVLSAAMLYLLGKKTNSRSRLNILKLSAWPLILAAGLVFAFTSHAAITFYLIVMAISDSVFWFVYFPILSHAVEQESNGNHELEYAYILDHEIWINIGRAIATFGYFFVVHVWGDQQGVLSAILAGALMQLIGLNLAKKIL